MRWTPFVVAIATASQASAQPPNSDDTSVRRHRFTWGVGLDLGGLLIGKFDLAGSFAARARLGGMVTSRFALLAELQVHAASNDGAVVQSALLLEAQVWVTCRFWLAGGVGPGSLLANGTTTVHDPRTDSVLMAALGVEMISKSHSALDMQLRFSQGSHPNTGLVEGDAVTTLTIGVGVNWF